MWCGSTRRLELDHVDKHTKGKNFRQVWLWREDRRLAELAKCRVLCQSCHRKRHADEIRAPHGTHTRYVKGCRCVECKAAHAAKAREYLEKNRERIRPRLNEANRRWREKKRAG